MHLLHSMGVSQAHSIKFYWCKQKNKNKSLLKIYIALTVGLLDFQRYKTIAISHNLNK